MEEGQKINTMAAAKRKRTKRTNNGWQNTTEKLKIKQHESQ